VIVLDTHDQHRRLDSLNGRAEQLQRELDDRIRVERARRAVADLCDLQPVEVEAVIGSLVGSRRRDLYEFCAAVVAAGAGLDGSPRTPLGLHT
jgi:hypothetical protein